MCHSDITTTHATKISRTVGSCGGANFACWSWNGCQKRAAAAARKVCYCSRSHHTYRAVARSSATTPCCFPSQCCILAFEFRIAASLFRILALEFRELDFQRHQFVATHVRREWRSHARLPAADACCWCAAWRGVIGETMTQRQRDSETATVTVRQ